MRRLLAVVAYAALCSSAVAQTEMTEGQRRTVHVPYVRALTDCVAQAILADAQASQLAQGGDWIGAAKLTGPSCNSSAVRMMSVHDQLYGPGTGSLFFKGGYSEDLPRALSTRIRPELERRAKAQAQKAAAERKREAEAEAEKSSLLEANAKEHMECLTEKLAELVLFSSENADTLASVALTHCAAHVQKRASLATALFGITKSQSEDILKEYSERARKTLLAEVVNFRTELAKARLSNEQKSPPAPPASSGTVPAAKSY